MSLWGEVSVINIGAICLGRISWNKAVIPEKGME
jgi:hypothetical protein